MLLLLIVQLFWFSDMYLAWAKLSSPPWLPWENVMDWCPETSIRVFRSSWPQWEISFRKLISSKAKRYIKALQLSPSKILTNRSSTIQEPSDPISKQNHLPTYLPIQKPNSHKMRPTSILSYLLPAARRTTCTGKGELQWQSLGGWEIGSLSLMRVVRIVETWQEVHWPDRDLVVHILLTLFSCMKASENNTIARLATWR